MTEPATAATPAVDVGCRCPANWCPVHRPDPRQPATAATLGWRCALHNVSGRGDDDSLTEHENAEHDGLRIAVIVEERDG